MRTFSGGMRRRLDVAASLVGAPRVLFLDEPSTGLDPRGRLGLWRLIADLANRGTTVLLTTQYLEEADRLADAIVVLDHGTVIQTGVAIADDLASGMFDRFRALPMTRSAVLAGRTTADAARNVFVVALMTGVAAAIGFRFHAGPTAALAAIALAVGVGVAFSWVFALVGLVVRDPESAGIGGLLAVIPLVFTSSTFVPIVTFPGWLQAFAKVNPVTVVVDALRALTPGGPMGPSIIHGPETRPATARSDCPRDR